MIIDVSGILKETGGKIPVSGPVSLEDTDFLGEEFHFESPMQIEGTISNNGESLIFRGKAKGEMQVHCARCQKPMTVHLSFDMDETFMQDREEEDLDEDVIVFSGHTIDLTEVAANCFFMNVPGKYLCKEDCKGLCIRCGADLNQGDCGCDNTAIDPRWAALKEIMDQQNEDE